MACQCTSLLLQSKTVPQNYKNLLKDFQRESARYLLIRFRLLVKVLFMDIILNVKVTVNIAILGISAEMCISKYVYHIYMKKARIFTLLEHSEISSIFRPPAVFFGS